MVEKLTEVKERLKTESVILHVVTKKGKGYEFCEENPEATHGISVSNSDKISVEYSSVLGETLTKIADSDSKIVAAICAAPMVLGGLGVLKGRNATCYPGFEPKLIGANVTGEAVEVSDNVITGKGPGLVINFGLALVAAIKNEAVAEEVAAGLLV